MKYLLGILCVLVISVFISCENVTKKETEVYQRVEKFENGEIKERKVYESQYEFDLDKNYQFYSYYSDGTPYQKGLICNGLIEGNYYSYDNTRDVVMITKFKNGYRNGTSKTYNMDDNLITEVLYIDDTKVRWKVFTTFEEQNMIGYQIFDIDTSNIASEEGFYFINKEYEVIDTLGNYYNIVSNSDTVKYGDKYSIELDVLIFGGDTIYGEVLIGELNKDKEFVDSTSAIKLKFGNERKVTYSTKEYHEGDNLILGKIYVTQDTVINDIEYTHVSEFLLFHDFYVKK